MGRDHHHLGARGAEPRGFRGDGLDERRHAKASRIDHQRGPERATRHHPDDAHLDPRGLDHDGRLHVGPVNHPAGPLIDHRKVLELEAELDDARLRIDELRAEIERARDELRATVEEVRRSYRRDLVPMRAQTVVASRKS